MPSIAFKGLKSQKGIAEALIIALVAFIGVATVLFTNPQTQNAFTNLLRPQVIDELECYDDEDGGPPEDLISPELCDDDTCWCAQAGNIAGGHACSSASCNGANPAAMGTPIATPTSTEPIVIDTIDVDMECYDEEDGGPPDPNDIELCDDNTCWCADPGNIMNGHVCSAASCNSGAPVNPAAANSPRPTTIFPTSRPTNAPTMAEPNPDELECYDEEDGGPPDPNDIELCDDNTCWCADPNDIMNGHVCSAAACNGGSPSAMSTPVATPTSGQPEVVGLDEELRCYDDEDGGPPEDLNNPEACDDNTCWCADPNNIANGHVCNRNSCVQ
jgi:hypothetical protein